MQDSKFILYGDAYRLLSSVHTKTEFEIKYLKSQEIIEHLDLEITNMKKKVFESDEERQKKDQIIGDKNHYIEKLERQLAGTDDRLVKNTIIYSFGFSSVISRHYEAKKDRLISKKVQTDTNPELNALLNKAKRDRKWLSNSNMKKKESKFIKLSKARIAHESSYVHLEIEKILRSKPKSIKTSGFSLK